MKAKTGFNLRDVCGEHVIVAEGDENIDFSNLVAMNESSAYLWRKIQDLESFTIDDMARLLMEEYEVDRDIAVHDCEELAAKWAKAEIIEGEDIPEIDVEVTTVTEQKEKENYVSHPHINNKEGIIKSFFKKLFK